MPEMYAGPATTTILRGVPVTLDSRPGAKGSCARVGAGGGKSIVAIGGVTTTIAASSSATISFSIRESGHIDRLFLTACPAGTNAALDCAVVTSIIYDNDNLTSGSVGGSMFAQDAQETPVFGHLVEVNHDLQITITNLDPANALVITPSFSVA